MARACAAAARGEALARQCRMASSLAMASMYGGPLSRAAVIAR
jgi:hypothetical protein